MILSAFIVHGRFRRAGRVCVVGGERMEIVGQWKSSLGIPFFIVFTSDVYGGVLSCPLEEIYIVFNFEIFDCMNERGNFLIWLC